MPDYTSGFTGAINDQNTRDLRSAQTAQIQAILPVLALKARQAQQQEQARALLGPLLKGMVGDQGGMIPPPPSVAATGAPAPAGVNTGPLPPGVGTPSVPMAPPAAAAPIAPAAPVGAPPIPPYQALPQPPADTGSDQTGGDAEIGTPPSDATDAAGAPPTAAAPTTPAAPQGRTYSLTNIIRAMKQQGVPDDQVMNMLDELRPTMSAENQQELNALKIHNLALQKAMDLYQKTIALSIKQQDVNQKGENIKSLSQRRSDMTDQGQQRIDLAKQKMATAVGGSDNVKRSQPVFNADGTQIGWNVLTKGGQTRNFDLDGNPRDTSAPAAGPKTDQNNLRAINSLNSRLRVLDGLLRKTPQDLAEIENIKGQLRTMGAKVPGGRPAAAPAAQETKVLNGKTYVKKGGQWYAQ